MARYDFYEIRSERLDVEGPEGRRRSFQCAERPDLVLFTWQDEAGALVHVQLLFRESYLEWSAREGLSAGTTSRHERSPHAPDPGGAGRRKGVRTLHAEEAPHALAEGRRIVADAALPLELDGAIRGVLLPA